MDNNLDRELDQFKMSQGMLGQTSQQVAEQVKILKNKRLFLEYHFSDSAADEMQVFDREGPQREGNGCAGIIMPLC